MNDVAHAFWVAAPGQGEIRTERLPPCAAGELLIRTRYSGISRGTESLVFNGRVPPSEYQRMRAPFQQGDFPGPVKYGYCTVGQVEQGSRALVGRHVFVLYPHQTRFVVSRESAYVLPDDVPPERAVLAANLETAINGLWDGGAQIGDRIAVIGAGTVGCLVAWLAGQLPGCRVELVDINSHRESVARALGVHFAHPETVGREQDLVIHTSGSPAGLALALRIAGFEARVLEMSWYGDQPAPLQLGGAFHSRRLTIQASQVGAVSARQRARWDTRRRMELGLSLLRSPALDILLTGESAFEDLPEVMAQLATAGGDTLCHVIRYS
jgi:2-desacetyl-2-hydroxyethyl bacteriochlorophyllide A dehydrogenase